MSIDCKQHSLESKTQLKKAGLKVTPARLGLLDIFKHSKKPINMKEVLEDLGHSDLVTLYRNVESLENLGLIKKINLGDRQAYYEISSPNHHHHLICKICGKITDIQGCKISVTNKNFAKTNGFAKITEHSLEFFGICESCNKK